MGGASEIVALACRLFEARVAEVQIKDDGGLRPATDEQLKGLRDMVQVIFDDVAATESKGSAFDTLPPGVHEVTIKKAEDRISSNDTPGLNMLLVDSDGRGCWDTLWITDKTKPNVLLFARAIGCEPVSGVTLNLTPEGVANRRATVTIIEEEYHGKHAPRVERLSWRPPAIANTRWVEYPSPHRDPVNPNDIPF